MHYLHSEQWCVHSGFQIPLGHFLQKFGAFIAGGGVSYGIDPGSINDVIRWESQAIKKKPLNSKNENFPIKVKFAIV